MKRPLLLLTLIPLGLWSLFTLPDLIDSAHSLWDWRRGVILLSGVLALWWMSAGMVLAARPAWLEQKLGGLDKLYRLHKNLGIGAGLLVFAHWMLEWLPKNLAKAGWIERPFRGGPRGPRPPEDLWIGLAKDVGEWAGYILLALVVIALIRRIPYRYFRLVHKAFGLVFVAGAFHGLMLMPASFWQQPLGWLTAAVASAGVIPALLSLAGHIGRRRQTAARIEALTAHGDGILEVVCRPTGTWPGHQAGQFLFADFGHRPEGAHPFTIATAWDAAEGTLTLAIKALGDYTNTLAQRLTVGQAITLEGPYGRFDFATGERDDAQIWVAGGIGITPFLAKLQERAGQESQQQPPVDFFYCSRQGREQDFPANLGALCQAAGVRLHARATDRDGPLDPAEVQACLKPKSSVWFCGPSAWGSSLARTLVASGLPAQAFHREIFEFR